MRTNIPGNDEDFFKISIGIKMLDFVILDLKTRFGPDQLMVSKMLTIKPSILATKNAEEAWSDLEEVVVHFGRFFPDGGRALQQELPVLITSIQVMQEQNLNSSSAIYPFILIYSFYNQPIIGNKNLVLII